MRFCRNDDALGSHDVPCDHSSCDCEVTDVQGVQQYCHSAYLLLRLTVLPFRSILTGHLAGLAK